MKKIILFIGVLLFMAVPAMAVSDVTITCTHSQVGDVNWVTVTYGSDTNRIRAFGLDINVAPIGGADGNIIEIVPLDANYRIYPGQIVINDDGEVEDYNTPYDPCAVADMDASIAVEMGSLYTTDSNYADDVNAGYNMIPGLSGTLLKFAFQNSCAYQVDVNARRGGIVMEDPCEQPSLDSPLCYGTVPDCEAGYLFDFGDAPDSYQTLLASNGPKHPNSGPMLGANRDAEADGQPTPNCDGDDLNPIVGPDDEDGVTFISAVPGTNGGSVTVTASAACLLNAWADFDQSGTFTAGEQIFNNQALVAGANPLTFDVPVGAVRDVNLVTRWRVNEAGNLTWEGAAPDNGEVEDYNDLIITCPPPGPGSDPTPSDGATCVPRDANLIWTPGAGTVTQDIYFGTTNPPPLVASDEPVSTTEYDVGTMEIYTCYFWRIDEKNVCDTTTGTVWHFKTGPTNSAWPCCATCLGDADGSGWVKADDLTVLDILLDPAPGHRYQYTSGNYNACGDYNQDGWNKADDLTAIDILLDPLPGHRKQCPTCP